MVVRIEGVFEKYEFPDEHEELSAKTFTPIQLMYLQSMLATKMQQKLQLAMEGQTVEQFTHAQEYYRGAVETLQELVTEHDNLVSRRRVEEQEAETLKKFREASQPKSSF